MKADPPWRSLEDAAEAFALSREGRALGNHRAFAGATLMCHRLGFGTPYAVAAAAGRVIAAVRDLPAAAAPVYISEARTILSYGHQNGRTLPELAGALPIDDMLPAGVARLVAGVNLDEARRLKRDLACKEGSESRQPGSTLLRVHALIRRAALGDAQSRVELDAIRSLLNKKREARPARLRS